LTTDHKLEISRHERVLSLILNRPEKRNALDLSLCRQLVDAFEAAGSDDAVGAILLRANGPAFCAGMDLSETPGIDQDQLAGIHDRLFTTIHRIRKPVIAAAHGAALAGGTGLVANAHIVIVGREVLFGLTEVRIGLWPVMIFRAVAHAIGERRAVELSLTGRQFGAEEALRCGLAAEIADDPMSRAGEIANIVSQYSPIAVCAGLEYVHQIRGLDWDHAGKIGQHMRDRLLAHPDFKEGVRAFLEKRKPIWPSLVP